MLGYFKEHIQFPYCKEFSISAQLILQISKDLEIDPMHIATFDWDGRTAERYRQTIREYLGYRVSNIQDIELAINYLVDKCNTSLPPRFSNN